MTKQITISEKDQNNMIFDNNYYGYEVNGKFFTIGYLPVKSRLQKWAGRKDKFYVIHTTQKDYKVYRVTNDLRQAEWSYCNAMNFELFADAFKAIKPNKSSKKTQDLRVSKKSRNKKNTDDPVLKIIYAIDTKPKDDDSSDVLAAKRNLATIRPKDMNVIIIPDKNESFW